MMNDIIIMFAILVSVVTGISLITYFVPLLIEEEENEEPKEASDEPWDEDIDWRNY